MATQNVDAARPLASLISSLFSSETEGVSLMISRRGEAANPSTIEEQTAQDEDPPTTADSPRQTASIEQVVDVAVREAAHASAWDTWITRSCIVSCRG